MANGALVNVSPPPSPAPRRKRRYQAMGTTCDLGTEEKYRHRLDLLDLFHQEREASPLVIIVRLSEEASGLLAAGEKPDKPVGAKALRRVSTGLQEQSV